MNPPKSNIKIIPTRDPKQCCGVFFVVIVEIVDAKSVSGSLHQNPVVPLMQDVFVRISASAASRVTCARSLYAGLLSKISLSGSLHQDPVVGPLVQDHCMRISCARFCVGISVSGASRATCARSLWEFPVQDICVKISSAGSCRSTCARSVCEDLLCKISLSGSLHQDHKILSYHLCKISVCGPLVQDLSVRMSASGSCMTTCARSLYADLLSKISLSGSLRQDPVEPLVQDLCMRIVQELFCRISAPRSCSGTTCTRSLYADLLRKIFAVGALVQDRCMRISCARCLCQDLFRRTTCARSLMRISCA